MLQKKKTYWLIFPTIAALALGTLLGVLMAITQDLPQVEALQTYEPSAVTTVLSDDGQPIQTLFVERRIPVPLEEIPPYLVHALIAVEDSRFYQHFGLDIKGILRALVRDIMSMRVVEGGSTLTQQLAKVLFLTPEKTIIRKLKEAVLALNIEREYTKNEILTIYLNQIYLGEGAYGVEAAARTYFGKSASKLGLAECALIASLPKSPSRYSPFRNPDRADRRMRIVLRRLADEGYITEEVYRSTSETGFLVSPGISPEDPAPFFTEMVRLELEKTIGANLLYRGGLTIETTLDMTMQKAARAAIDKGLADYEDRHSPRDNDQEPVQASLLALEPSTGEIKALVGGRDFSHSPYNRATQARRQPGSSFKPIIYAAALSSGFSPSDIIDDEEHEIELPGQEPYTPRNYSGNYYGPVTLRTGLEKSLNAASVDLLIKLGYQPVIDTAGRLGITTDLKPYPSMALGVFDVSLLEMVSSFGTFANGGISAKPVFIRRVSDREGTMIWETPLTLYDALSPQTSFQITNLLEGVIKRGTGRRARSLQRSVAGKTGTTDDFRDAWFIGFTPEVAAGAWIGYDHNRTLGNGETGPRAALPIWLSFMEQILGNQSDISFKVPQGIELVEVDPITGLLASPECSERIVEAFIPGTSPEEYCIHQ